VVILGCRSTLFPHVHRIVPRIEVRFVEVNQPVADLGVTVETASPFQEKRQWRPSGHDGTVIFPEESELRLFEARSEGCFYSWDVCFNPGPGEPLCLGDIDHSTCEAPPNIKLRCDLARARDHQPRLGAHHRTSFQSPEVCEISD
jgi:hypothetical protein